MRGVEILVGAETAGSHGFGVGTVRLMGIGIGRGGGGGGTRMVRFGRIRISIMNCIDSHVYRA